MSLPAKARQQCQFQPPGMTLVQYHGVGGGLVWGAPRLANGGMFLARVRCLFCFGLPESYYYYQASWWGCLFG